MNGVDVGRTVNLMAELDKVIYDIERCVCHVPDACRDCSHYGFDCMECMENLLKDAIELLKSQQELIAQYESKCQTCKSRLEGVKPF